MDLAEAKGILDQYVEVREQRRGMERAAEKLKEEQENPLKAKVLEALRVSGAKAIGGTKYTATLVTKPNPQVADWGPFYAFIREHNAFELLQKRISPPAVKERWDAKVDIPGVVAVDVTDLSITKN